jgi:hypothetical protein
MCTSKYSTTLKYCKTWDEYCMKYYTGILQKAGRVAVLQEVRLVPEKVGRVLQNATLHDTTIPGAWRVGFGCLGRVGAPCRSLQVSGGGGTGRSPGRCPAGNSRCPGRLPSSAPWVYCAQQLPSAALMRPVRLQSVFNVPNRCHFNVPSAGLMCPANDSNVPSV